MDTTKIYGPPGTGKTTTLISTLEHEFSNGLEPSQVAYLTFSRSASEEAKARISERLSGRIMRDDLTWFRTIHSACFKLLGLGRHQLLSAQYQAEFSERTGYKIGEKHEYTELFFSDDDYNVCLQARALAAARGVSIFEVIAEMGEHEALARIHGFLATYNEFKGVGDERRLYDFLDMLTEYLDNPRPLPVDVVILDEAQDLSRLQWRIFRHMIEDAQRVYIAGDDDQSIYNFIGADPDAFNAFPADKVRVLEHSYRVPRVIGRKADQIIQTVANRQPKHVDWNERPGQLLYGPKNVEDLPLRDVPTLILCRHRRQALAVSKKLIHIPHALERRAIIDSYLSRIFTTHMSLLEGKSVPVVRFDSKGDVDERPIRDLMNYLKIRWSVIDSKDEYSLPDLPDLAKVRPLWESGRNAADRRVFGDLWNYWRKGYPFNVPPKLRIMTMHAAKGQEADDVFVLTDCNETVYQNQYSNAEKRLMYVALTRAKERCIICMPRTMTYMKGFF